MTDTLTVFSDILSIMSSAGRGRLLFSAAAPSLHCQAPGLMNTRDIINDLHFLSLAMHVNTQMVSIKKINKLM